MQIHQTELEKGMNKFIDRINMQKHIYSKILSQIANESQTKDKNPVYKITNKELFKEIIENFGPVLNSKIAKSKLENIYDIGLHKKTGALIIANKGATLYCLSPRTQTPFISRHIGLCIYLPGAGIEFVNVGIVGDVYTKKFVFRGESACTPSFLYGSQRCNCAHQWASINELAANFHHIKSPKITNGQDFESWVQKQMKYSEGKHLINNSENNKSTPGFILMHLDTQNGMGSGFSENEFSFDMYARASMRHRGEYSAEQIDKVSMWGGFEAIGLKGDPRREKENLGYKITYIALDFLNTNKECIFLTNNPLKINALEKEGYKIKRIKSVGMINLAGSQEAEERHTEFHHLNIDGKCVSFEEEFKRLKKEIINEFKQ